MDRHTISYIHSFIHACISALRTLPDFVFLLLFLDKPIGTGSVQTLTVHSVKMPN